MLHLLTVHRAFQLSLPLSPAPHLLHPSLLNGMPASPGAQRMAVAIVEMV